MPKVLYKPNIIEAKELACYLTASTIREAIDRMAELYPEFAKILEMGGYDCFIVSVNDLEIPKDMWAAYPVSERDEIVLSHEIGFVGILGMIGIYGTLATTLSLVMISLIINAAIYALNYFTRPDPPKLSGGNDFTSTSPTYAWSGIVTTHDVDIPIPVGYGKHRLGGNVINHFISTEGDKNYWNVLIALCHGPIGGIWKADGSGLCQSTEDIIQNPTAAQMSQSGLSVWNPDLLFNNNVDDQAFHTNNATSGSYMRIDLGAGNSRAYRAARLYAKASNALWNASMHVLEVPESNIPGASINYAIWDIQYADDPGGSWTTIGTIGPCTSGLTSEATWADVGAHRCWQFVINNGPVSSGAWISELCMLTDLIDIPDILVNGNPFINYSNIGWDFRIGTLDQTQIEGFDATYTIFSLSGVKLTQTGYIYTTTDIVEAIELKLTCPGGLWKMDGAGNILENSVTYNVKFRLYGTEDWTDDGDYTIADKSKTALYRYYKRAGINGRYDFKITRVSPEEFGFRASSDLYLMSVSEIVYESLAYPGIALFAAKILATEYLQGELPNFQILCDLKTVMVPKLTYGGIVVEYDNTYWNSISETYVYANWDSNGHWVSDIGTCTNTGDWVAQTTKNPIWNTQDLIQNRRYGHGEYINLETVDIERHKLEAQYAHELVRTDGVADVWEHRFEMDGVIDGQSSSVDLMAQVASTYDGVPLWVDGTYKIILDRPQIPAKMLNMGNIVKDSFKWAFYPLSQRPNAFVASFLDKTSDYARDNREIVDTLVYTNNIPIRSHSIHVPLVTRESQILRLLKKLLNVSKYRTQLIEFSGGIDSIGLQGGDTFYFSHDVNQWLVGGRVLAITGTSLTLDRPVTIDTGTYKITVRLPDPAYPGREMFESRNITNPPGTYEVVTIESAFSVVPVAWETLYVFGLSTDVIKQFRALSSSFDEKRQVSIKAVETTDAIWTGLGGTIIDVPTPHLPDAFLPPGDVIDLIIEETADRPGLRISYNKPENDATWYRTEILLSLDGIHYFTINPGFQGTSFEYFDVMPGMQYYVKVVSFSKMNVSSLNPPIGTVTILGIENWVPDIGGLELFGQGNDQEWRNRDAKFAWRPIALRSGAGVLDADTENLNAGQGYPDEFWQSYKIEMWVSGNLVRTEYVADPYYIYSHEKNVEDNVIASPTITIKVWNYSIFNVLSVNPAILIVTNSIPPLIVGLTSKAVGGGVEFTWNPSSAKDHDYYEVRTSVGTGGWSSWVKVEDCYYYRELTSSEILLYGSTAEIYIQVRDVDTFGQTSSAVATNKLSGYVWGELLAGKISSPDGKTYFDLEYPEIHCEHPVTGNYSKLSYGALKFYKFGISTPYWYTRRLKSGIASDGTYITLNWELTPKVTVAIKKVQTWVASEPGDQFVQCYAEEISSAGFRVKCKLITEEGSTYTDQNVTILSEGSFINNPTIEEPTAVTVKKIMLVQEVFTPCYYGVKGISGKDTVVTYRYKINLTYKLYYKLHSESTTWTLVGTFVTALSITAGWTWNNTIFENQPVDRYDFKVEYTGIAQGNLIDMISGSYGDWHGTAGESGYYVYTGGGSLYQGDVAYLALEGG